MKLCGLIERTELLLVALVTGMHLLCSPGYAGGVPCPYESIVSTYNPSILEDAWGNARRQVILDDLVLIPNDERQELIVLDISDPVNIRLKGFVPLPHDPSYLQLVDNNLAYIGYTTNSERSGFMALDLNELEQFDRPTTTTGHASFDYHQYRPHFEILEFELPHANQGIIFDGGTVYIVGNSTGVDDEHFLDVHAYDFTEPLQPKLLSTVVLGPFENTTYRKSMRLHEDHLYLAISTQGVISTNPVQIIDVGEPHALSVAGQIPGTIVYNMQIYDNKLLTRRDNTSIYTLDDPANPVLIASHNLLDLGSAYITPDQKAYVLDEYSYDLAWYDISDLTDPQPLGGVNFGSVRNDIGALRIVGDFIYCVSDEHGYLVLDREQLSQDAIDSPVLGTYHGRTSSRGIAIKGDTAYLVSSLWINIVDIADPANPVFLGEFRLPPESAGGVRVAVGDNEIVYIATFSGGMLAVDVSNPALPTLIGSINEGYADLDLKIAGDYVFSAAWEGFCVYDISDPTNPVLISRQDDGNFYGIDLTETHAFLVGNNAFGAYDITDPTNPVREEDYYGYPPVGGSLRDVKIIGDIGYFIGGPSGLTIGRFIRDEFGVNYETEVLSNFPTWDWARDLKIQGTKAYISDMENGLVIVDIGNPYEPKLVGNYHGNGSVGDAWETLVDDDIAYLQGRRDLFILDVSECSEDCAAEFTGDSSLDIFDLFGFLEAYNGHYLNADLDENHAFDIFDVFAYLDAFNAGCP